MSALNHSVEVDMSAVWRAVALHFARDLGVERARLRRWQLRLRWRASTTTPDWHDRLALRAWRFPFGGAMLGDSNWRRYPIAGPRGVLP